MAGDIGESFNLSFQADSLHSGSISFGRFENESLSWERRSSFSHNRYLEEVEKCLKPGSVIEKKAYLEAHFKKKGHLCNTSSESNNGTYSQTSDSDVSNRISYQENFELNGDSHYVQFDKSPEGSDYHEQCETRECKTEKAFIEDPGITFSNLQMEFTLNNSGILEDKFINNVGSKELHQAESITHYILSVNDEADVEVKKYLNNIKNNDQSVESIDPTLDTETAGDVKKTNSELSSVPSPKLTDASGTKPSKTEVQSQNAIFSSSHMNPAKNPNRRERESPRFMNMEKNLLRTAIPSTESVCRTPKLKDFGTQKKLNFETKSSSVEKISGVRKSVASQPSIQKGVQAADRLNRIINSRKSDARAASVAFNFTCNERAARRKEFYKKLEEKMHAKEAEINQIQATSQEKTQAQIKCFRKSLNFKATPMPSFYHAPVSSSDGNKAVPSNIRTRRVQKKPTGLGSGTVKAGPQHSRAGNDKALSVSECVISSDPLNTSGENCPAAETSKASLISSTPSTNRSGKKDTVMNNPITEKKEQEKGVTLLKHRETKSSKLGRSQNNVRKQKAEPQSGRSEVAKKSMKPVGVRSNSRMAHLTVGAAS